MSAKSGRCARADVHLLADVRAIPLNVADDTRASAVGAGACDEGRPAQLLVTAKAVAQLALLVALIGRAAQAHPVEEAREDAPAQVAHDVVHPAARAATRQVDVALEARRDALRA